MKGGVVPGGISVNARVGKCCDFCFCQGHIGAVIEGEFQQTQNLSILFVSIDLIPSYILNKYSGNWWI